MKLFARLFGGPVLRDAIQSGDLRTLLEVLLATPELIAKRYKDGDTLLHWAALFGQSEITSLLLQHGAQVDAKDDAGFCPLHCASSAEVARLLLGAGASPLSTDAKGNTPLGLAAEYNRPDVARVLLDHGAPVDAANYAGATPLAYCAIYDHVETAKVLLEAGADPKAKLPQGLTLPQLAEAKHAIGMVKLLAQDRKRPNGV
jgi:ankyrin repeat protein